MSSINEKRVRRSVPRFRRKNLNENLVDLDDAEAQDLINQDLKSIYKWTTDFEDNSSSSSQNNYQIESNCQQNLSLIDQSNQQYFIDVSNTCQSKVNISFHSNENHLTQYDHQSEDDKDPQLFLSETNLEKQQWTIVQNDAFQLNLIDENQQISKYDFDSNENSKELLQFLTETFHERKFSIKDQQTNNFIDDQENLQSIHFDCSNPSNDFHLSLPQQLTNSQWIQGFFHLTFSLNDQQQQQTNQIYSPKTSKTKDKFDLDNLENLVWSIDFLKDNLLQSYLINLLEENRQINYSINEQFHPNLSIDDQSNRKQFFSLIDFKFEQKLSILTENLQKQIFTLIDSNEIKEQLDLNIQLKLIRWSLENLPNLILNLSPNEYFQQIYSIQDQINIDLNKIFFFDQQLTQRTLRKYRCKHFSIQSNDICHLDSQQICHLVFKGNESIAIGEQSIQNDFQFHQQQFKDLFYSFLISNDNPIQSYDIQTTNSVKRNEGPCLYRTDYERDLDENLINKHREIGYISFDNSKENPIYYLNKSFKRFLHPPKTNDFSSFNVYQGYKEFIEKAKLSNENYFRPYDSTDLRHLLYWYTNKQYLFSKSDSNLLKFPHFICRRIVLRTILANLYCDSQPWKLLITRINSQFYLALANQHIKKPEEFTQDDYSGFRFEQLFTSDQPNTTRQKHHTTLEKPQENFHTIRYWNFGRFNILYSSEIDAEYVSPKQEIQTKPNTSLKEDQNQADGDIRTEIDHCLNELEKEEEQNSRKFEDGYVEMKCTNKKIFYRDENKLQTLYWWAQMWLGNVKNLMISYKSTQTGSIEQIDYLKINDLIGKFLSKYNLRLKYCFSYLYSFLNLIEKSIQIDDPFTIHTLSYIPQELERDSLTGQYIEMDLPNQVYFRYKQIKRTNQRYQYYLPQSYVDFLQRNSSIYRDQFQTLEQELKKRCSHRGRNNSFLKKNKFKKTK